MLDEICTEVLLCLTFEDFDFPWQNDTALDMLSKSAHQLLTHKLCELNFEAFL